MLRVEMPEDDAAPAMTQFYSPASLYCLTPSSEEMARAALRLSRPEPVSKWEMDSFRTRGQPKLGPGPEVEDDDDLYDEERDFEEHPDTHKPVPQADGHADEPEPVADAKLDNEIRACRKAGDVLGDLTNKYGSKAVVRALGVMHVAGSLGVLDDPENPNSPEDGETSE